MYAEALLKSNRPVFFEAKQQIHRQGEKVENRAFRITEGRILLSYANESGRIVCLGLVEGEGVFGEDALFGGEWRCTAFCLTPVTILPIDLSLPRDQGNLSLSGRELLRTLWRVHPAACEEITFAAEERKHRLEELWVAKTVTEKVRVIVKYHPHRGAELTADLVGASREMVSRVLRRNPDLKMMVRRIKKTKLPKQPTLAPELQMIITPK